MFTTLRFKLHDLSACKDKKLRKSLKQNDMAYFKAMVAAKPTAEKLVGITDTKQKKDVITQLKKDIAQIMKPLPFGSAIKAGVIEECAAQVLSYAKSTQQAKALQERLIKDESSKVITMPSYQQKFDVEVDYKQALEDLVRSTNLDDESDAVHRINRILRKKHRPICFQKYRISDGFMLLEDNENRIFAYLNLWAAKDKRAEKISINLIDVRKAPKEKQKRGQKKPSEPFSEWIRHQVVATNRTGMLFPLEFGPFQRQALKTAIPKTAELLYRDDGIYLHVAIEHQTEIVKTETIMGIDRGILNIAAYAVRDPNDGRVISQGAFSGLELREHQRKFERKQKEDQQKGIIKIKAHTNYGNNQLHHITNAIVEVAKKHKSLVVVENLEAITNGAHHTRIKNKRRSNFNRLLSRAQYAALLDMLTYKLLKVGLPKPVKVNAAYTSMICPSPHCGYSSKNNRGDGDKRVHFECEICKYIENADVVGAINVAGKKIWLMKNGRAIKGKKIPTDLLFQNWQAEHLQL